MKYNIKLYLIFLIIPVLLFTGGCNNDNSKTQTSDTITQAINESKYIEVFGKVKTTNTESIFLNYPVEIREIFISEGQKVSSGEALVALNLDNITEDLRSIRREIEFKEKSLNIILSTYNDVNNIIDEIKRDKEGYLKGNANVEELIAQLNIKSDPNIKKTLVNLKNLKETYITSIETLSKSEELLENGAISKEEYTIQEALLKQQENSLEDILLIIEEIRYKSENEYLQQKSSLDKLKNEERLIEESINKKEFIKGDEIISTIENGVISDFNYKKGEYINPEIKIMTITDLDSLVVEAEVSEEFFKDIKLGSKVEIMPLADKDRIYEGTVTKILGMAINKNGETIIPIEISYSDYDNFLLPNLNVDVRISK